MTHRFSLICILLLGLGGCIQKKATNSLWIYTSIYKDVIADLEPVLKEKFPDIKFNWFQSGSENVAVRVNAELLSGRTKADLILTSDPFWYRELEEKGYLLKIQNRLMLGVNKPFLEGSEYFLTVRLPLAIIAYHPAAFQGDKKPPSSWSGLLETKNHVSMGSPVESGTAFNVVAQLARVKGWSYFKKLHASGVLAAGGNSAVINRIETKERPIGVTLLENVLEAKLRGSPVEYLYPEDGAIWVPSPAAVMAKSSNPELARRVFAFLFSPAVQRVFVKGRMYSPVLANEAPESAKPYSWVLERSMPWSGNALAEIYAQRESIKKQFSDLMMN